MPKKVFVTLEELLPQLPNTNIRLESRTMFWKFGTWNYGEVTRNWHNRSDGDKWDIFAPGYGRELPVGTYKCTGILGVLLLNNDNHKIAVTIDADGYCPQAAQREIQTYQHEYCRRMKKSGVWWAMN